MPHIARYFNDRRIDLAIFQPDDARVADPDGRTGRLRPKRTRRGGEEFIIYHPNAASDGKTAAPTKQRRRVCAAI